MKDALSVRQCGENIRAVLRLYDLPIPVLIATLSDRVLFDRSRIFLEALERLVPDRFERWDIVQHHHLDFPPGKVVLSHGLTAVRGWRERVAGPSMQIVEHRTAVLEVDMDRFNPNFGAGPALLHLFECLHPGKTSPWTILRGLQRRGLSVLDVRIGSVT